VFEPQKIPGMIEPGEQALLAQLAASRSVADAGLIVEFGCFFGRSTACLANGASTWWTPEKGAAVRANDSFGCSANGGFAPHVRAFAQRGGVESLLETTNGRLNFLPVYRHFTGPAESKGLLRTTVTELRDATHDGAPIGLMHLDAPKFYDEFKPVLSRFFPSLALGGYVVFQDFLYHWSATLIAAAELLAQAGVLEFERSFATSMVTRVIRPPTLADLAEVDLAMLAIPTEKLLDDAIARVGRTSIDRPEQFVPRLHLAKFQHLWQAGRFEAAEQAFVAVVAACGGGLSNAVFQDYREMMRHGFTVKALHADDH
jgi:hypothetical protein